MFTWSADQADTECAAKKFQNWGKLGQTGVGKEDIG